MKVSEHFSRGEFSCKCGCGFDVVDVEMIELLEKIREHFKSPIKINSACRCTSHNHAVGGMPKSQHVFGKACDIVVKDVTPRDVYMYLDEFHTGGLGNYDTFTHVDVRGSEARWDYSTH